MGLFETLLRPFLQSTTTTLSKSIVSHPASLSANERFSDTISDSGHASGLPCSIDPSADQERPKNVRYGLKLRDGMDEHDIKIVELELNILLIREHQTRMAMTLSSTYDALPSPTCVIWRSTSFRKPSLFIEIPLALEAGMIKKVEQPPDVLYVAKADAEFRFSEHNGS